MSEIRQQVADGARPRARVGDEIAHGEPVPGNVVRMTDMVTDVWHRAARDPLWFTCMGGDPVSVAGLRETERWWPMTVVEVDPEPQPAEPCDECESTGQNCWAHGGRERSWGKPAASGPGDREPDEREVADTHLMMTLGVDRLDGVIPAIESLLADRKTLMLVESELSVTRPEDVLERLSWLVRRVGGQGRESLALSAEIKHTQRQRDEARELLDKIAGTLGVLPEDDLADAVWRLVSAPTPAAPGPLVLTLPKVPAEAVALIGAKTGTRYEPVTSGRDAGDWHAVTGQMAGATTEFATVLKFEGSVTVEFAPPREPRTWPKLDVEAEDPDVVDVYSSWPSGAHRWIRHSGSAFYYCGCGECADRTLAGLRELGEVREVLT